jgi:hypothetical protein
MKVAQTEVCAGFIFLQSNLFHGTETEGCATSALDNDDLLSRIPNAPAGVAQW